MRRHKGFTLIELLVVISVIALLVGILLPALSKARVAAMSAVDASNMRQVGIALYVYATDNNGYTPLTGGLSNGAGPIVNCAGGSLTGCGIWGETCVHDLGLDPAHGHLGMGPMLPVGDRATVPVFAADGTTAYAPTFGDYMSSEILYSPQQKEWKDYATWITDVEAHDLGWGVPDKMSSWTKRHWHGHVREAAPFTPDGVRWGVMGGGYNRKLKTGYNYRGQDYAWYRTGYVDANSVPTIRSYQKITPNAHGYSVDVDNVRANWIRATIEHPDWAQKFIMANRFQDTLDPNNLQVNALLGDGSVRRVSDAVYMTEMYPYTGPAAETINEWHTADVTPNFVVFSSRDLSLMDYWDLQ